MFNTNGLRSEAVAATTTMKTSFAILAISLLVSANPCRGDNSPVSYDFGGTLSDHFNNAIPGTHPLDQGGGVLFYHNNSTSMLNNIETRSHKTFLPNYTEAWSSTVEATVPLSYDGAPATAEAEISVGLFATTVVGGIRYSFANELLLANDLMGPGTLSRGILAGWEFGADPGPYAEGGGGGIGIGNETVTLSVSFDATTKILSATADGNPVFSVDIGPTGANWGMMASDVFEIGLLGLSFDHPIASGASLSLDNFAAVPEPNGAILLIGAASMALFRRRRV